jgi:hypothetical protein
MSAGETVKFTIDIILSTEDGEMADDDYIEDHLRMAFDDGREFYQIDVLSVTIINRTGEL